MKRVVDSAPELKGDVELFDKVYGAGFLSAVVIRAELGDLYEAGRSGGALTGPANSAPTPV